jgi:hypothetical protein
MTPATIIKKAMADGVNLALSPSGTIRATGEGAAVNRWLPVIREHKPGIVAALQEAANEMFCFSPPGDPANDNEALQERAAIMAESNGWDAATALQEARWQVDKERCWRGFLRNGQRVLEAPAHKRDALLTLYQVEAARRYGQAAGANMAGSLSAWVKARAVH